MPKKGKKGKRIVALRGKGGLREIYESARSWSNNSGKPFMEIGRSILDRFIPGAGAAAKRAMNYLGWGAYAGSKNSILQASPVPLMHAMPDRGVRVVHKEFIGNISSSVDFVNQRYSINPGTGTFPWLSGVASNFQKYKLNGLIFYFKSTAANTVYSTNNALGTVMGATQYNVYDPEPASLETVLNLAGAMEEKPTRDCIFPLECDRFHALYPTYYVRSEEVSDDKAKYDPGVFNLATAGSQAVAVVGQLWVAYDVTLIQPVPALLSSTTYPMGSYVVKLTSSSLSAGTWLGSGASIKVDNLYYLGQDTPGLTTTKIKLPAFGQPTTVDFEYYVSGGSAELAAPTPSLTNLTQIEYNFPITGASGVAVIRWRGTVVDPNKISEIGFSGGTPPSSTTSGWAIVSVWNQALAKPQVPLLPSVEQNQENSDEEKEFIVCPQQQIKSMRALGKKT